MEINISNMPENEVYRFDTNKYVISTMLKETRGNSVPLRESTKFFEVYKFDKDGTILRMASGTLIDSKDNSFSIKDLDNNMIINFKIAHKLELVPLKELYELRSSIERNYKKENETNNTK